jgi:hypothetical protein
LWRTSTRTHYDKLYGEYGGAEGPVTRALGKAYRLAGAAGTDETLKRLLLPALATWDPKAARGCSRSRTLSPARVAAPQNASAAERPARPSRPRGRPERGSRIAAAA